MSADILFVNPYSDTIFKGSPESHLVIPPLGQLSIIGNLEANGYRDRVEFMDQLLLTKQYGYEKARTMVKQRITESKPYVVLTPFMYATEQQSMEIMKTAKKVGSKTVMGGHLATFVHKQLADTRIKVPGKYGQKESVLLVDAIVRKEGEYTTLELLNGLFNQSDLNDIKGVTFYDGEKVVVNPDREFADINKLPTPAFHRIGSFEVYDGRAPFEESRGCTYRCSFCSIYQMFPNVRLKDLRKVRSEIETIYELGGRTPYTIGEFVLITEDRALGMADIMTEFDFKEWAITAHPTLVLKQKKILPELSKKRLREIAMGIESANQNSLDVYNKGTTPKMNQEAIDACVDAGIHPLIYFINFQPYMSLEDLYENIVFLGHNFHHYFFNDEYPNEYLFKRWIPGPGTPLFDRAAKDNLINYGKEISKFLFIPRDKRIADVISLIEYFYRNHGESYYGLLDDFLKQGLPNTKKNLKKLISIKMMPMDVLRLSYSLVKHGTPKKEFIDWYCTEKVRMIQKGVDTPETSIPLPLEDAEKVVNTFKELQETH
jgi:radical SAM superfamily enzyme YgiQ (UPF0313 family)